MSTPFKYRAFISYSHRDKSWGDWLHKGLERYRVPKRLVGTQGRDGEVPATIFPVFRDREELPSAHDLGTQITAGLEQSAYLIVICSPASAASRWVNEEILSFKRLGRENRILSVIVGGEPNASDKPEAGAAECFPEALRFALDERGQLGQTRTEPIAADARPEGDGRDNALLKVIAGLLGVNFNDLKQREIEVARRRARVYQAVAGSMAVLAGLAIAGGVFAYRNERRAEAMAGRAVSVVMDSVFNTIAVSNRAGVSRALVGESLIEAEKQVDDLYAAGVRTPELQSLRADVRVRLARHDLAGNTAGARPLAEEARSLATDLVARYPGEDGYANLLGRSEEIVGAVLRKQGDLAGALAAFRRVEPIAARLAAAHPADRSYQQDLGIDARDIGQVLFETGKFPDALTAFRRALDVHQRLAAAPPDGSFTLGRSVERDVAADETSIGDTLKAMTDAAGALRSYRAALAALEPLAAGDPADAQLQGDVAHSHAAIADALMALGEPASAVKEEIAAQGIFKHLVEFDKLNVSWQDSLGRTYVPLGDALNATGQMPAAFAAYEQGLAMMAGLAMNNKQDVSARREANLAYDRTSALVDPALARNDGSDARTALEIQIGVTERLVAFDPNDQDARFKLAVVLAKVGAIMILVREDASARPYLERARDALTALGKQTLDPSRKKECEALTMRVDTMLAGLGKSSRMRPVPRPRAAGR